MKIYDCFMYFDEEMLLDFRLNYLNEYVDKFVIVESGYTHSGNIKKLLFDISKFEKFRNKIHYIVAKKEPSGIMEVHKEDSENKKNTKYILNAVKRENHQRNYISEGLLNADPDDYVMISDIDEIPNLEKNNLKDINLMQKILIGAVCILASSLLLTIELPNFSELAEQSSPAVVNISSSKTIKSHSNRGFGPRDFDDPFDEYFKRFFGEAPNQSQREREVRSGGSGFIISKDGYLLTNNHVVEGAEKIIVSLSDRREYKAELIGSDKKSDIALLKIDSENLPVVKIGKSKELRVGEWVVAIGSPFQLNFSTDLVPFLLG